MKFNKNKCFFASVYVAAVSAMTFTGFTSYAAEQNAQINETLSLIRGEEIQWAVSEIVQNAQKTTVEETLTAVNEAKAAYEAKLEEERKAAEEAERIAREQAEKAAALQAEKELMVKSSVYPNSVSEVIYQSGQFSPAMSGWLDRVRANAGYSESALQAAEDALNGSNPVGDCLYFSTGGYGMQIGDHFFH